MFIVRLWGSVKRGGLHHREWGAVEQLGTFLLRGGSISSGTLGCSPTVRAHFVSKQERTSQLKYSCPAIEEYLSVLFNKMLACIDNLQHRQRLKSLAVKSIGTNVEICRGFVFHSSENLAIGDNVYIGPDSYISAIGGVTIGSGVIVGPKLTVYSANHNYKNASAIPYDDVIIPGPVTIGDNTWIGGNVIIVPGVTIGEGCIVGAGSVVVKGVDPFTVVGGNPAQSIGRRDVNEYIALKTADRIYLALKQKGIMQPHCIETSRRSSLPAK